MYLRDAVVRGCTYHVAKHASTRQLAICDGQVAEAEGDAPLEETMSSGLGYDHEGIDRTTTDDAFWKENVC